MNIYLKNISAPNIEACKRDGTAKIEFVQRPPGNYHAVCGNEKCQFKIESCTTREYINKLSLAPITCPACGADNLLIAEIDFRPVSPCEKI